MINQELYIEVLELFDLIKEEDIFIRYKQHEHVITNNKEIKQLINEYNFISDTIANIDYEPFITEQTKELEKIEQTLNNNKDYQLYLECYEQCNTYLNEISKLIFKDIIGVEKDGGCTCK